MLRPWSASSKRRAVAAQTHPALKDARLPPLLPLSLLADGNPETRTGFQISPDGKSLLWLQRIGGRRQLHVRPIDGSDATVIRTSHDVGSYQWAADSRHIAVSIDPRDEEHSLPLAIRRLTTYAALRARLGDAAHAWWKAHATPRHAADDWERILAEAARLGPPRRT